MSDVTITLSCEGRTATVTAMSLAQARSRIGAAWPTLFEGDAAAVAALEVVMTEIAEGVACAS